MKYILLLPRLLFKIYFGIIFFLVMILSYPLFKLYLKRGRRYEHVFRFQKRLSMLLQILGLVPQRIISKKELPPPPFIIISNHSSHLDIVHMFTLSPHFFLFLGKSELLRWPILRIFFKGMNIPVKRNSIRASKLAQEIADKKLKEGKCLAIFPEGGIFPGAPRLSSFKNGVFKLAIENNVPLVPVSFLDNWHLMGDSHPLWDPAGPGISRVIIHESIDTHQLKEKDLISLREECKAIIEAPLKERYNRHFE